jgi:ABC-type glycerol-3-phosphate transport system permease component
MRARVTMIATIVVSVLAGYAIVRIGLRGA